MLGGKVVEGEQPLKVVVTFAFAHCSNCSLKARAASSTPSPTAISGACMPRSRNSCSRSSQDSEG